MTLLPRRLLLASAVLLAPLTSSARPPDCDVQCGPTRSCTLLCTEFSSVITCGEYGACAATIQAEPSSELQASAPAQADDAEAVCRAPADQAQG
ncbi:MULTISPECIES: hypothetical protein [unclassified Corallococcus]|uniref:hypothetical protein n=1 Tax=unclassified Corallococcus TaxID=2685029 RepID=UPI001A8EC8EA|nr:MULTISPECIES: hypothetical protein [unclassified Corallococcus]MBN9685102.1 hypothetical protein [Corallococcus sp. NCSPR001]WAS83439.1 hypothetical protein O0N60_29505 [Corallococcus sp. NCRR]